MLFSTLSRWLGGVSQCTERRRTRGRKSAARGSFAPHFEAVEGREVPSTFSVLNLNDDGAGSLRAAIVAANVNPGADAIDFAAGVTGTIKLTSGQLDITDSLTINGPGAVNLALDGGFAGNGYTGSRVLYVTAGVTVSLSNLTITRGNLRDFGVNGGGILNEGSLTVSNCVISDNHALTDPAGGSGRGGGIANFGDLAIVDSVLSGNTGGDYGGGIFHTGFGTLTVQNSTIAGNKAWDGAGIFAEGGPINIQNSTLSGNQASNHGGGMAIWNTAPTILFNCTLFGNTAYAGAGIGIRTGSLEITNCTLSGNAARGVGGGIAQLGGFNSSVVHMRNTILAGNTSGNKKVPSPDLLATLTSSGYNLIGSTKGGAGFVATDLLNVKNVKFGPLQYNGGPTQTMALLAGSPALNAGNPATTGDYDQRGAGFARVVGGRVDIGAFEVQAAPPTTAPTLSINDAQLREGNAGTKAMAFTVSLTAPSSESVTVNYATADGTATAGSDYVSQSGALTFAPGETSRTIEIVLTGDHTLESSEAFYINLSNVIGAVLADPVGLGTILNDDR